MFITTTREQGYVLLTSIIFLVIVTVLSLSAVRIGNVGERTTTNTALQMKVFETSEAARTAAATVLDEHIYYRGWPSNNGGSLQSNLFPVASSLTIRDADSDSVTDNLYEDKVAAGLATDVADDSTVDIQYSQSGQNADVYVFRNLAQTAPGSSAAMVSGYEGTGRAAAGGGGNVWFDLRAVGRGAGGARSITNSDYRFVVRN